VLGAEALERLPVAVVDEQALDQGADDGLQGAGVHAPVGQGALGGAGHGHGDVVAVLDDAGLVALGTVSGEAILLEEALDVADDGAAQWPALGDGQAIAGEHAQPHGGRSALSDIGGHDLPRSFRGLAGRDACPGRSSIRAAASQIPPTIANPCYTSRLRS